MADARRGVRWLLFLPLVVGVVILDQLAKGWVLGNVPEAGLDVVGPYVRLIPGHNTGGLFGLFQGNAPLFAIVSIAVMALIVAYESRVGAGILPTIALGLLLGGALGNFVDRIRLGFVVDFVDMGVGAIRWYTYNIADAAISTSIVLLIAMALVPSLADIGAGGGSQGGPVHADGGRADGGSGRPTEPVGREDEAPLP